MCIYIYIYTLYIYTYTSDCTCQNFWTKQSDASHLQHVPCSSQGALLASGFKCCNQCLQIKSVRPVERESASSTSLKILEALWGIGYLRCLPPRTCACWSSARDSCCQPHLAHRFPPRGLRFSTWHNCLPSALMVSKYAPLQSEATATDSRDRLKMPWAWQLQLKGLSGSQNLRSSMSKTRATSLLSFTTWVAASERLLDCHDQQRNMWLWLILPSHPRRSSGCMGSKDKGIAISLLHHVLQQKQVSPPTGDLPKIQRQNAK